jgi:outer membrane usher protein
VVKVKFDVDRGRAVVLNLRQADGARVPFGTDAMQGGKVVGVVGQGSRLLARVGADQGTLRIEWKDNDSQPRTCDVDYRLPAAVTGATTPVIAARCRP